jgi:hypothetical protein
MPMLVMRPASYVEYVLLARVSPSSTSTIQIERTYLYPLKSPGMEEAPLTDTVKQGRSWALCTGRYANDGCLDGRVLCS